MHHKLLSYLILFIVLLNLLSLVQSAKPKKEKEKEDSTKEKPSPKITRPDEDYYYNEQAEIEGGRIYELSDASFDLFIKNGRKYKWFVLFYIKTCGHCKRAKEEIRKTVGHIEQENIRFAQVDTDTNIMTSVRFNVTAIPYIVMIENGTMYPFNKYPNQKNLLEFINTSFNDVENELVNVPRKVKFYYIGWVMMKQTIESLRDWVSKKVGYEFKTLHFILLGLAILAVLGIIEYKLICMCCNDDLDPELLEKLREQNFINEEDFDLGEFGEEEGEEIEEGELNEETANLEKEMIAKEKQMKAKEKEKVKEVKQKEKKEIEAKIEKQDPKKKKKVQDYKKKNK